MQCKKKLGLVVAVISLGFAQATHAGAITVYTALEEDEIAAYLKAANAAQPFSAPRPCSSATICR